VDRKLSDLTHRQREVAVLVAKGMTNREIGERLSITPGSVANHIQRIFERLDCSRRTQLAAWVAIHARVELSAEDAGVNAEHLGGYHS
jgi:DNA-binding CsgD family transcriptional regulator